MGAVGFVLAFTFSNGAMPEMAHGSVDGLVTLVFWVLAGLAMAKDQEAVAWNDGRHSHLANWRSGDVFDRRTIAYDAQDNGPDVRVACRFSRCTPRRDSLVPARGKRRGRRLTDVQGGIICDMYRHPFR